MKTTFHCEENDQEYNDMVEFLRSKYGESALYIQLAEECAELSKAALKIARLDGCGMATDIGLGCAYDNLTEEIGDIMNCFNLIGVGAVTSSVAGKIQAEKLMKCINRVKNASKSGTGASGEKDCGNCEHKNVHIKCYPCNKCFATVYGYSKWEPMLIECTEKNKPCGVGKEHNNQLIDRRDESN